ncbi:MAG: hypothetical protein O2954_19945 [bacterium]|nr:hypothetical protein [bacterium]
MAKYEWVCITEKAAFAGRDGAGALTFRDKMWLLGGWNPKDKVNFPDVCNSEVWSSSDGETWVEVNERAPWEGRHTAGYAVHDDKMWIVGGDGNQGRYQNDVWFSEDGVQWQPVSDSVPWGPRALHHTVAFDGKIWVMGGQTVPQFAKEEEAFYQDVWNTEDGKNWTRVTEHAPWAVRGMIGGSAVMNGRMWLLGGGTYETPTINRRNFYNDVWSSGDGVNWELHTESAAWTPRQYHDVAVWDEKLWVMEGFYSEGATRSMDAFKEEVTRTDGLKYGGNRKDVWYSADGVEWTEVSETPWAPRHAASLFAHDDALWMVAGNNMFPDVWKLVRK